MHLTQLEMLMIMLLKFPVSFHLYRCELNTITEPLRYGWPTQITVTIRDQYGDAIVVPELKVSDVTLHVCKQFYSYYKETQLSSFITSNGYKIFSFKTKRFCGQNDLAFIFITNFILSSIF